MLYVTFSIWTICLWSFIAQLSSQISRPVEEPSTLPSAGKGLFFPQLLASQLALSLDRLTLLGWLEQQSQHQIWPYHKSLTDGEHTFHVSLTLPRISHWWGAHISRLTGILCDIEKRFRGRKLRFRKDELEGIWVRCDKDLRRRSWWEA